ncbi:MAG: nitronate monooxygenase [Gemmatimonadetes bacterium]|nr:nitronate monooxygenase [Gemmatimonadota bacterium]
MSVSALPMVIQGGMGIAVSNWKLASAVAAMGQLGVVSGTALDSVFVRRLQDGDPCGAVRRALANFPKPEVAAEMLKKYFKPGGRAPGEPYAVLPMYRQAVSAFREQVTIAANFVEVWLAKEGHQGKVGINLLTKVQMPTLPSLYGAMLAGGDVVLMGAGIPREIPGALDALAVHATATLRLDVDGQPADQPVTLSFDPTTHGLTDVSLKRPDFYAIVAAHTLATNLSKKATGKVNGFIVEAPTAGGHNAPPRGPLQLNERGEPIYGPRDEVDLDAMRALGVPFWLAGSAGTPEGLEYALSRGAAGIQVGTAFAYADESGFTAEIKREVLRGVAAGLVNVRTDPRASPTGFPFKLMEGAGIAQQDDTRERCCDLGYLRTAARLPDGKLVYRCSAAPVKNFVNAGGTEEDTVGRRCLCNGLMSAIGLGQVRSNGVVEPPLVTSGDALRELAAVAQGRESYAARDVLAYVLGPKHSGVALAV